MNIYPLIAQMSPEEADAARKSLLIYCHLDTLVMVWIWEKLRKMASMS